MEQLVRMVPAPRSEERISKTLADFDYESLRRLERTRVLVRAGPALGLMGTLIPLAPGLAALAQGDVGELTLDLRLAFSITILGLLIGAVAFGISLVRDRLYGQDLSDLEYMVAVIVPGGGETVTETDLVRALGKAPRRPGRHSRPDEEQQAEEARRAAAARQSSPIVLSSAVDTPGLPGADPTEARGPVASSAEARGAARPPQPAVPDDRDYLAELTAELPGMGDDHPAPGPNGDRPESGEPSGAGTPAGDPDEEWRRR